MGILDDLQAKNGAVAPAPAHAGQPVPVQTEKPAATAEGDGETVAQWRKSKEKRQRLINALVGLAKKVQVSTGKVNLNEEETEAVDFFSNPRAAGTITSSKTVFKQLFPDAKVGDKVHFKEAFTRTEKDPLSILKLAKKWDEKGIKVSYVNKEFTIVALPAAEAAK
jgi:hypothetical protein